MDYAFAIICALLIVSVFLPFFWFGWLGKSKDRLKVKAYDRIIQDYGLNPSHKEHWGNSFIALDNKLNKLLFIKDGEPHPHIEIVDLAGLVGCAIIKKETIKQAKENSDHKLIRLDLELSFSHAGKQKLLLNFYDINNFYKEDFEVARAQRWKAKILGITQPLSPFNRAA